MPFRLVAFSGVFLGLSVLALAVMSPALADQTLPPDQQAKVEDMLKKEGFTKWEEIELDDGMIEVDEAVDANGK